MGINLFPNSLKLTTLSPLIRSCHVIQFKDKKIMLDCGIHPGLTGMDALPFVDCIEADQIDLLLISHFHLDHAGALPWFLQKTTFRGKCYMTHATKAIFFWLLSDYIKVNQVYQSPFSFLMILDLGKVYLTVLETQGWTRLFY